MTQDSSQAAEVPHDVGIGDTDSHRTVDGKSVDVHTLKVKGLLKLLSAVKAVGLKDFPAGALSPLDFLDSQQRAELSALAPSERTTRAIEMLSQLSGEQKFLLRESERRYKQAIFDLVCECETLLPAALSACTSLKTAEVEALDAVDALELLSKAIAMQNWPVLVEAASRFFGQIGGLLKTAGRQSNTSKAGGEAVADR